VTGEDLISHRHAPEGTILFGWCSYKGAGLSSLATLSAAHLAPEDQGPRPWESLCGRRRKGKGSKLDTPAAVETEWRQGERLPCRRCFAAAAKAA
jgi:hypothetical protein